MRIIQPSFALLLVCLCALSTSACRSLQHDRFIINQATIQNDTDGTLHTVRVQHEPTRAVGAANVILPHRAFNVGFDGRTMMADSGVISWSDDHGTFHNEKIILPKNLNRDQHEKHLVYRIAPNGKVSVQVTDSN
jgi:hypothetical protein